MNEFTHQLRLTNFMRFFRYGIYCLLFLVGHLMFGQAVGTIQIGSAEGSISGSVGLPVTNYDYSYTQQIVSAAEYSAGGGVVGNITKLRYKATNVGTPSVWNDWKVYIANTTKSAFLDNTDWVPFSDLTLVYNGIITPDPVDSQWFEITFITPFAYTGNNLVIAVHENAFGWATSPTFSSYNSTPNSGIVWRQDGSNVDPSVDVLTAFDRTSAIAEMQFEGAVAPCLSPANIQVTPTLDGGNVTWTANSNAATHDWIVVANNAGQNGTPLASGTGAVSTATITGLSPSTEYDLYVKTICTGADGVSLYSIKVDFRTLCGVVTEIDENFDTVQIGTTPFCWTFIGNDFTDFDSGYGEVINFVSASGDNSFLIYNYFNISKDYILIGSETNNLGNGTKELRFFARGGEGLEELIVGTMSDPNLETTFTPLANGTIQLTDGFVEYVFALPVGTDDYFAFKHGNLDFFQEIYIDDVTLADPPVCEGVDFGTLTATEVTNTQAKLSWISNSTNFDIEYGPFDFVQGTGTLLTNIANNYVLSNLDEYTIYSYYVRSNCGSDGVSAWRGPFTFTTQKVTISPWFEGFASATADGWNNVSNSVFNLSNTITALMPSTDYVIFKNLFTAAGNGSGVTTLNVGPVLPGDNLAFDYRMVEYYSPYGPVDASAGSIDVFISTDFGINYTLLANLPYNEVDGWQNFNTSLSSYVGQLVKIKIIANYNFDPDDYEDHYLGFDNFYIGSCSLPSTPEVVATTTTTATLSWNAIATDTFEIEYGLAGFVQGTGTTVSVTGGSHVLSNLIQASIYDFYIRKNCGIANSPWIGMFKFSTTCDVITTGFAENFDTTSVGNSINPTVPVCWSFIDGGSGYGYVSTIGSSSSPNSFYIYNDADLSNSYILISPEILNLNDGNYRVRFKAMGGGTGYKLKFGTMSNKLDEATFTQLQEINLTTTQQEYIIYLPIGTNDFFAFKHSQVATYQSIYIDDVVYEPNPICPSPTLLNANKNFANLSAELTWSGPETILNNNFEIEWGVAGFVQGTGTLVNETSNSTTITNLVVGESYSFYVRRNCTNEDSNWVGPYTFEMEYCIPNSLFVEGTGMNDLTIDGSVFDFSFNSSALHDTQYLDTNALSFVAGTPVSIEANYFTQSSLGFAYAYNTSVWIDLDQDGVFSNSERFFYAVPVLVNGQPDVTHVLPTGSTFEIPGGGAYVTGVYRMRIVGTETSGMVNTCSPGLYSFSIDMNVNIEFPCIQPSNIDFVDVGFDYVTLDWQGQGNTNFEIEYGLTGFTQGSGTVIQNVTKPYTVNNLTPGTTYDFYLRKQCGNLFSDWSAVATTYVFCDTPEPTGSNSQTLTQYELLSDLVIVGQDLKFYTDPALTQEVPASTVLQVSGTYFVTQTINCESDSYLIVDVTVIPRIAQPIVDSNQNFCDGGTLGDVPVTLLPGATVIWYADNTSTTPLPVTTVLDNGTYYVSQTDGVTTSIRVQVNVTINPTPADLVSQPINLCNSTTFGNLVINNLPGTTVRWYVSPTATTPIDGNVPVSTGTYYVTQAFGICESQRVAYQLSQFDALDRPSAISQVFCGSGLVSDLVAEGVTGAQMMWYSSSTSVNALSPGTTLSTGTYYVSQTINGCVSDRRAVAVRVISLAAPQVDPITICGGGMVSDIHIPSETGVTYRWFNSPSSSDELAQNTALVTGTYFVERVQFGCVSARTAVQITIASIPAAPTGSAIQTFVEGSSIANLILNQVNVIWYATFNDSQNGVNPLAAITLLENGATYYAVIIGSNGCPSLPFAVTVNIVLSNDEFDKEGLKYYPNPVDDILNVDYVEPIRFVEVFDLLGKRVKTLNTNTENIQIDLSDLASGTYMIQLKTDSKSQFIKVIKK